MEKLGDTKPKGAQVSRRMEKSEVYAERPSVRLERSTRMEMPGIKGSVPSQGLTG